MKQMKIQLIDRNKQMCESWESHFKNCPDVIIHNGDFFSLQLYFYSRKPRALASG